MRRLVAAEITDTKQQLESMTKSWYDQRAELADARNKITDLTRRLEDALSDKVIAEKSYREARVERDQAAKDVFTYAEFTRNIATELGLGTMEISFKEVITSIKQLYKDLGNISTMLGKANSQIDDKDATIRRLKEKLENVEPYTSAERVKELEQRITDLYKEAERLSMENEDLSKDCYQLTKIKQAFKFISQG